MSDQADTNAGDGPESPVKMTLVGRLRAYFFAGILITAPISITVYIAWNFIDFVDRQVTPLIPAAYNPKQWGVPGVGLLLVAVVLTLVGALTAGFLGRVWLRFSEWILSRTPVLNGIYSAVKQVFETVLAQKSNAFREVVLLEYPRKGIWTLGFITGQTASQLRPDQEQDWVNVFVPTTPNPTSGFLLFLPRGDVHVAPISVEDGLKLVISGGIVAPPEPPKDWASA
ncbi:MAG TPA: DUF502 domain-containing protein [Candidatus Sulfotelmatobacter sp.]|jgi:uncharacterized membrane protein|nr:DUF502 domain-containing protein [Candidatus Sulfotelmatobacter sp.]